VPFPAILYVPGARRAQLRRDLPLPGLNRPTGDLDSTDFPSGLNLIREGRTALPDERAIRRLVAIMSADVVGYSRLMEADEGGTLDALKRHRAELVDPMIAQYGGRVVGTAGDGLLCEFPSVVDAVHCAVDIQAAMSDRNVDLPDDRRMQFRIGINLGDVLVEGDDIFGDGVNVAARLQQLAAPGSVLISGTVYDQVRRQADLGLEDFGTRQVKNIREPIRIYRAAKGHVTTAPSFKARPRVRRLLVASAVCVLVVAAALAWLHPWNGRRQTESTIASSATIPDQPSIAVLPFNNMSADPDQEYFADGITEDLITDLSKVPGLFVISRNSTFTYKGKSVEVRQIAAELGVRYVLEGSVRRAGSDMRINVQLIDAKTGGHLWADRYDGSLADIFDLQDEVTVQIVNALALELSPLVVERVRNTGTDDIAAYDAYLLGLSFYHQRTPDGFAKAHAQFEKALAVDPEYADARIAIAKLFGEIQTINFSRAMAINFEDAAVIARSVLAKANAEENAGYHVVLSWLALRKYQHELAIAESEHALELNPNDVDAMEALARAKIFAGDPAAGIELVDNAIQQNPVLLARPSMLLGLAAFAQGDPEEAAMRIRHAFALGSEEVAYAGILASAYGLIGRQADAQQALVLFGQGFQNSPDLSDAMLLFPFLDRSISDRLARGLELAGIKVWYTIDDGGYLPLHGTNRMTADEIRTELAGRTFVGKAFEEPVLWQRIETADGTVRYTGFPIQIGAPRDISGVSRIKGDTICDSWPDMPDVPEFCSTVFRLPPGNARSRWGSYVLLTDSFPGSFETTTTSQ
jgi:adenylate cyclase